jgi:FKBP-type peptidyl-prolyl cis-trans isomerase
MKSPVTLCFGIALVFVPSLASAKGADKKSSAKESAQPLPSYEEIVNSYPDGVPLCPTEADIVGGDDQGLSLEGGSIAVNEDGVQRYQCFGTKLTVRKKVTLKGKTYRPGTKLTVDKDLYWIEVSGWPSAEPKSGTTVSPSGADPQKAPADVAAAPAGARKTASGLASKVLRPGTGTTHPHAWDTVTVNYTGWTTDGKMFDTSAKRGEPATFGLGNVIAGWTEGVQLMVEGESRRFWIPAKLAYGETPRIGRPAGMLVFDIELLKIIPGKKPIEVPSDLTAPPKSASKTASGLAYLNLTKGHGKQHPHRRDRVRVHYSGWTTDGKMFDSSVERGEPAEFRLNGVIRGWTEGVQLMVVGDKTRFWIPGELAYGNSPSRPGVPSGMLVFDIELLEIQADDSKPGDE